MGISLRIDQLTVIKILETIILNRHAEINGQNIILEIFSIPCSIDMSHILKFLVNENNKLTI